VIAPNAKNKFIDLGKIKLGDILNSLEMTRRPSSAKLDVTRWSLARRRQWTADTERPTGGRAASDLNVCAAKKMKKIASLRKILSIGRFCQRALYALPPPHVRGGVL
jgi:hypothetical protein